MLDKIYVIVSGQPDPILLPLLDKDLKPKTVVLLVTPQMSNAAENLKQVIQPTGVQVTCLDIKSVYDLDGLMKQLDECVSEDKKQGLTVALNATGGTKPMSIFAYQVFYSSDLPVFYVDSNQLIWLEKRTLAPALVDKTQLNTPLKLKQYLLSHGFKIDSQSDGRIRPGLKKIGDNWIANVDRQQNTLGMLNGLAARARDNLQVDMENRECNNPLLGVMLNELAEANVLTIKGKCIKFESEESRFFANGGWLETDLLKRLQQLKKEDTQITDVAGSVELSSTVNNRTKNELDVVCLKSGQLFIFECKTKNMKKDKDTLTDALYKMDSLSKEMGGIRAVCVLVSYRKVNEADQERAKLMKIKLIQGNELMNLDNCLRGILT